MATKFHGRLLHHLANAGREVEGHGSTACCTRGCGDIEIDQGLPSFKRPINPVKVFVKFLINLWLTISLFLNGSQRKSFAVEAGVAGLGWKRRC